jgi:Putative zinc-finger
MDHNQATQFTASEKYLLDELTPEEREEFEQHFFDCQECALDLRATDAFITAVKHEFTVNPVRKTGSNLVSKRPLATFWPAAVAWCAMAASLLVIVYQNVIFFPQLENQIAELKAPEILPAVSLVGGNSRGGQLPAVEGIAGKPFLLALDLPAEDRFSSYSCLLYAPSGSLSWRVEVSSQLAKDTVSIRVPPVGQQSGDYTLAVLGNMDGGGAPVDLAHYRFRRKGHE